MQLLRTATRRADFVDSEEEKVVNMLMQKSSSAEPDYRGHYKGTRGAFIMQALAALLVSVSPDLESMSMAQTFTNFSIS